MLNILENILGIVLLLVLALVWPFTSGWKAITSHRDIMYDQMSVLFLSFVGLLLYVIGVWRIYEWHYHGYSVWIWLAILAALYAFLSIARGMLHLIGSEDEDEEAETKAWKVH